MKQDKPTIGYFLLFLLFILLGYAGWISFKSIDWDVLKRVESQKLILPDPVTPTPSATDNLKR